MDFKKIARIFILAFALLNVYLLAGVYERQDIQDTTMQPTTNSVFSNMEELDIELPDLEGLEGRFDEVYPLQINTHDLLSTLLEENDRLTGNLNEDATVYYESFPSNPIELEGNPIEGFNEDDFKVISDFVLSEEVMYGSEYDLVGFDEEGRRFVYNQYIDDIPIADGTSEISLFVNDMGEVYAYEQTYAGPPTRQGNALDLIEGTRAIEILFLNNEIIQGSKVSKPILSYQRVLHLEDLSMYSPVWLVVIEHASDINTYRVDAVNGTILRQPVTPPSSSEDNNNDDDDETETDENNNDE